MTNNIVTEAKKIECEQHGEQDIAIACIHVCQAIDNNHDVGFFWCEAGGLRPDAWCKSCEEWNSKNPDAPIKEWMKIADFKLLCVQCWDHAKGVLYKNQIT